MVVEHDRHNQRFIVAPGRGAGKLTAGFVCQSLGPCRLYTSLPLVAGNGDRAELRYRFTGAGEVDLMSTYVPETLRNRGVAALLSQVT